MIVFCDLVMKAIGESQSVFTLKKWKSNKFSFLFKNLKKKKKKKKKKKNNKKTLSSVKQG